MNVWFLQERKIDFARRWRVGQGQGVSSEAQVLKTQSSISSWPCVLLVLSSENVEIISLEQTTILGNEFHGGGEREVSDGSSKAELIRERSYQNIRQQSGAVERNKKKKVKKKQNL